MSTGTELAPGRKPAHFVQLYRSQMRALRTLAVEAPAAHAVLYVLLERMNSRNALVASHATLAKLTGKSRATITRALAELRSRNFVQVIRVGNLTAIVVNSRIAWSDDLALRERLAVFDAQIIATESEQSESLMTEGESELVRLPPILIPPDEIGTMLDDIDPSIAGQQDLPL